MTEVEHGSFTPLVFSSCGGAGAEATIAIKRIASLLAAKRRELYSKIIFGCGTALRSRSRAQQCAVYVDQDPFVAGQENLLRSTLCPLKQAFDHFEVAGG